MASSAYPENESAYGSGKGADGGTGVAGTPWWPLPIVVTVMMASPAMATLNVPSLAIVMLGCSTNQADWLVAHTCSSVPAPASPSDTEKVTDCAAPTIFSSPQWLHLPSRVSSTTVKSPLLSPPSGGTSVT